MLWPSSAYLVVASMMSGTALIFWWQDRDNPATRALSLCMGMIGARLFLSGPDEQNLSVSVLFQLVYGLCEGMAILAGIEWGRRIAGTGTFAPAIWVLWLFRVAQLLILIYMLMGLVFTLAWPETAGQETDGLNRVPGLQWAIFAPIIGTAILCVTIAIAGLRVVQIDAAESVRLQSLSLAGPILLTALFIHQDYIPLTLTAGLLVFLWGAVRYLLLQGRRGQFMRQFLAPEVARLVQTEGMERTMQRQRRVLSVVSVDLRGFTAFARTESTDVVMDMLADYYQLVGEVTSRHGGTVKDHAGDGVLILVGAPVACEDHAQRALVLAMELCAQARELLISSQHPLGVGAGVATGTVMVGAIHGASRLEYVAVGNPVNLASRLCDRAEDGEVYVDDRTLQQIDEAMMSRLDIRKSRPEPLKGFPEPVPVSCIRAKLSDEEPADVPMSGRARRMARRLRRRISRA